MLRLQANRRVAQLMVPRRTYSSYKSPYGPDYKVPPNFQGISLRQGMRYGATAATFGVSAGIFAVYFLGEVPRIREDILCKLPLIGDYFIHEIPPEDNPF